MKFILTIDTEGDNQWEHGRELSAENIRFIPRSQDMCKKYLIKPTYLVTSEVCEDAFATGLSEDLLTEKIKNLTNQIEASFGKRPLSFRSGRFRFNWNVAGCLQIIPMWLIPRLYQFVWSYASFK